MILTCSIKWLMSSGNFVTLKKNAMNTLGLKQKIVEQVDLLDEDQLEAVFEILHSFLTNTKKREEIIELSEEQKQSIKMGQVDILAGRYISQEELDEQDQLWLNEP
jgi:uncharacterized protein YrzB (UPF0473 family)